MTLENNGVYIHYRDTKVGDTVLVFIHGWGIDHTYWKSQLSHFKQDYRVIAIDLPGFGKSGKNRDSWTATDFARDINTVIEGLHLKNVILIGHSMSGAIIVETALTYPDRIIKIVGVDNMKNIGYVVSPEDEAQWSLFYERARKDFKNTISGDLEQLFSPETDASIRHRVTSDILNSEPDIAIDCLENLDKYNFRDKLQGLRIPVYLVNSTYQETDTTAFHKYGISYTLFALKNTGHYPMIEKPSEFNALLRKALQAANH